MSGRFRTPSPRPDEANDDVKKHVVLLDHVALLLVYKSEGDIVATGLLRSQYGFTIVRAKNQTYLVTSQETNYLFSLKNAFKRLDEPMMILKLAAEACKRRMLARIKKLLEVTAIAIKNTSVSFSDPLAAATKMNLGYVARNAHIGAANVGCVCLAVYHH